MIDVPRAEEFIAPVTLVVRLLAGAAIEGHLVGHAEVVRTGEVVSICGADDLERLAQRLAEDAVTQRRQTQAQFAADDSAPSPDPGASSPLARLPLAPLPAFPEPGVPRMP